MYVGIGGQGRFIDNSQGIYWEYSYSYIYE